MKGSGTFFPLHSGYDITLGLKHGSPELGPMRLFSTLDFNFDNNAKRLVKASFNSRIKDDFHLGVKFEHNLEKFTNIIGQFVFKNDKGDAFLKADVGKEEIVFGGCAHENIGSFPKKY